MSRARTDNLKRNFSYSGAKTWNELHHRSETLNPLDNLKGNKIAYFNVTIRFPHGKHVNKYAVFMNIPITTIYLLRRAFYVVILLMILPCLNNLCMYVYMYVCMNPETSAGLMSHLARERI